MTKSKTIFVVDDEHDILELLKLQLTKASFTVKTFDKGRDFLEKIKTGVPDMVILDLMLPDIEGTEICKTIRKTDQFKLLPIIMLTAKGEELDRILGLELGADDYLAKPFSPRELVARIKAVLRRSEVNRLNSNFLSIGEMLHIDKRKFEAKVKGKKVNLTSTEFKILELLVSHPGWVFSREQILNHLWGNDKIVLDRTIDVHIRNLRSKIGDAGNYIKNIRSIGYKFEA